MAGFEEAIPAVIQLTSDVIDAQAQQSAEDEHVLAVNNQIVRRNQMIAAQQDRQARQQRDLLDKQQASARAQMGAWGVGGGGGSADAILEGMAQRSAETIAADDALAQFKMERNTARAGQGSGSNLLDSAMGNGMKVFQSFFDGP
ncbi:hypothetical protein A6A04_01675 [Paramagnetospirillum marisnigri]|uniref:Uncharacterized protein n=1 Tax=Paramagnetospirillum marisnigri TaxID=1285242 RepID=A0A178MPZ4_9PROT|nr:hypothetical protein [Paramagnetospirillum marisnigri]OAN50145.1 hypothetical protein A6A04_01675 [Paramagnetospirillum marisnigri]